MHQSSFSCIIQVKREGTPNFCMQKIYRSGCVHQKAHYNIIQYLHTLNTTFWSFLYNFQTEVNLLEFSGAVHLYIYAEKC